MGGGKDAGAGRGGGPWRGAIPRVVAVDRMVTGDHACLQFDSHDDRWAVRAAFTTAGLARGERVMIFTDPSTPVPEALVRLTGHGVPAERLTGTGQLAVINRTPGYAPARGFEPGARADFWASGASDAQRRGFTGVRAVGDMTWVRRTGVKARELADYEAGLTPLFAELGLTGICEYDRQVFPARTLSAIRAAHPLAVLPSVDALHIERRGPALTLVGSADFGTRREFDAALRTLLTPAPDTAGPPALVDLTGLSFLDAHSADTLLRLAAGRDHRAPLTVRCTAPQYRILRLCGAEDAPGVDFTVR